jgi:hypothetical protein
MRRVRVRDYGMCIPFNRRFLGDGRLNACCVVDL